MRVKAGVRLLGLKPEVWAIILAATPIWVSYGVPAVTITSAIDGIHKRPFNCGQNDTGALYQSLELCMRDSSHISTYMQAADGQQAALTVMGETTRHNILAGQEWLRSKQKNAIDG